MSGPFRIVRDVQHNSKMIVWMTHWWPFSVLEEGQGPWDSARTWHAFFCQWDSEYLVGLPCGWKVGERAPVQLLWEWASHYPNRKYARDPHCDADRYPPGKLRWEDSWNPDFKLESPEPSQGTAVLLMEWEGGGRRDERKKIFVARAYLTFLSGRPMNSVSCQGDVVKMQTADPWSQNSRGVVCARGPLIFPPFDLPLM